MSGNEIGSIITYISFGIIIIALFFNILDTNDKIRKIIIQEQHFADRIKSIEKKLNLYEKRRRRNDNNK